MELRKITEEEVRSHWIQRLSDRPNRLGRFGTAGMTATEMKAAFDSLPLLIVERFNALIDSILTGEVAGQIPAGERSLSDLLAGVTSGELAAILSVDGTRTLSALAAALDTHGHDGTYAPLDEDGRIPTALLPTGYDPKFEEAEAERAAAETRREELARAMQAAIDSLEVRETERDRRESEREARLSDCEERLAGTEEQVHADSLQVQRLTYEVENMSAAALGLTHTFLEDSTEAYEKRPPEKVLPMARLLRLGGPAGDRISRVHTVTSHGVNLLPYPYPAFESNILPAGFTVTMDADGSLILDGEVPKNTSFALFRETDGLALPEEPIYIDAIREDGITLYLRTGPSGTVFKTGEYTPSRADAYFGSYYVYLYITAGSSFSKKRIRPSITRGATVRKQVAYRPPVRFTLPAEVLALPAYGRYGNVLDFENKCYRQHYDLLGDPLPEEVCYPLDEELCASAWLPAEKDGVIVFENDAAAAVASTLLYGIRLL